MHQQSEIMKYWVKWEVWIVIVQRRGTRESLHLCTLFFIFTMIHTDHHFSVYACISSRAQNGCMQATNTSHSLWIHNSIGRVIYTHNTCTRVQCDYNDINLNNNTIVNITMVCHDTCSSYSTCCCTGPFSFSLMFWDGWHPHTLVLAVVSSCVILSWSKSCGTLISSSQYSSASQHQPVLKPFSVWECYNYMWASVHQQRSSHILFCHASVQ